MTTSVGAGRSAPKEREDFLERRDHEDHDHRQHDEGDDDHRDRVHQGRLDLALDGQRLFLVDRQAVEQRLQDAAGLAGLDQVAVQRVELHRVLAEGRRQAGAGLDVAADVVQQLASCFGLVLPRATMSKACSSGTPAFIIVASWRVKMAMSFCLIARAAAGAALLHLGDQDALAAQAGIDHGLAAGAHLAANDLAVLVLAFPLEDEFLGASSRLLQLPSCLRREPVRSQSSAGSGAPSLVGDRDDSLRAW